MSTRQAGGGWRKALAENLHAKMRYIFFNLVLLGLLFGCASRSSSSKEPAAYLPVGTGTDLAVNLGIEDYGDLCRLR